MKISRSTVLDLLVCTLFGSELATEITLAGLKQTFSFCSDMKREGGREGGRFPAAGILMCMI